MSEVKVNKISPRSGTAFTLGDSGDTFTVPSGATLTLPSGATLTTTSATLNLPTTITSTTEVKTNKISPATGTAFALGDSGDTFTVPSGATIVNSGTATGFGGGKIGQVVQTVNAGTETLSSTTATTIPDFTVAITPAATSSKILVFVNAPLSSTTSVTSSVQLFRDTTQIYMGDAASNRPRTTFSTLLKDNRTNSLMAQMYLDSPSTTSEVSYSCKWFCETAVAIYMNRSYDDTDQPLYDGRTASSITVMEVLA